MEYSRDEHVCDKLQSIKIFRKVEIASICEKLISLSLLVKKKMEFVNAIWARWLCKHWFEIDLSSC